MSIAPQALPEVTESAVKDALFLRGPESDATWSYLLSPDNAEMTVAILTSMAVSVNNDIAVYNASGSEDVYDWRRRALVFKRAVDRHLPIAKAALRQQNRSRSKEEAENSRNALRELAVAVIRHQQESLDADIRPEPHDEALWRTLDLLSVHVVDAAYTLRHMVTEGVWA